VRLRGIDSPEIRSKTPEEKQAATKSRDALAAKVINQMVFLQNMDMEKYGRVLADVFLEESSRSGSNEEQSINEWMLEHHYAVPYTGGTKVAWTSSDKRDDDNTDEYYKISTW
jgi:endonuclease YncB( thermonuclease family)